MKDIAKLEAIIAALQMELDAIRSDYERLRKHHIVVENTLSLTPLARIESLAKQHSDGHYTVFRFTTNYRVGLGTLEDLSFEDVQELPCGKTLDGAIDELMKTLEELKGKKK
jgi:hypothetical protein